MEKALDNSRPVRYNRQRCEKRRFSSSGRAPPCQGGGSEFEPRNLLQASRPILGGFLFCRRRNLGERGEASSLGFCCGKMLPIRQGQQEGTWKRPRRFARNLLQASHPILGGFSFYKQDLPVFQLFGTKLTLHGRETELFVKSSCIWLTTARKSGMINLNFCAGLAQRKGNQS